MFKFPLKVFHFSEMKLDKKNGRPCLHMVYVDGVACLHIHYVDAVSCLHIVYVDAMACLHIVQVILLF